MSTNRNTKGQFARKKDTKKAVKKPTKPVYVAKSLEENFAAFVVKSFGGLTDKLEQIQRDIDQIQRDIEQVRKLAHQTRTNSRANTVILNKTLAGVDLLKSGMVKEDRDTNVVTPPVQPEEPKAEQWVPKAGEYVIITGKSYANYERYPIGSVQAVTVVLDSVIGIGTEKWGYSITSIRPATPEEIVQVEREEKLKKLVRGCRVDTPDGEGIYLGFDGSEDEREHIVSRDTDAPQYASFTYSIDQLTPLT